jgi:co-chaperonin GroES (HSP10)
MRKFIPLGDRVLVLPDTTPVKTTGLAAPPSQKDAPTEGIVVAVGLRANAERTDARGRPVEYNPDGVSVGQRVAFGKYSGRDETHMGVAHKLLRLEELSGVIEEADQ